MARTSNRNKNRKRPAASKKRRDKTKILRKNPPGEEEPAPSPPKHVYSDEDLQKLLEPYSKDQLLTFLTDAAISNPSLLSKITSLADSDISHRKLFVHGLSWDTSRDDVIDSLSSFGAIEDCHVVLDKVTGRAKGYAFVTFASRAAAQAALKQPQRQIRSRLASLQLASVGPVPHAGAATVGRAAAGRGVDTTGRKLYVSNVHTDTSPDKLREFFAKFGEIEEGPIGFDTVTRKSRGFALFVYKSPEGLRKALEEPYKMFEGNQLYCKKALESGKGQHTPAAALPSAGGLGSSAQQVLAAVAAAQAQNLALYGQNPAYAAALLGQNPLLGAAANQAVLNPLSQVSALNQAAALNPAALAEFNPAARVSSLGALGGTSQYGSQGSLGLQGWQQGRTLFGRPSGSHGGTSSLF